MNLDKNLVISLLQLKGMGNKTAFKIIEKSHEYLNCATLYDVKSIIGEITKKTSRISYSNHDISIAVDKASIIMEKSEKAKIKICTYYDYDFPSLLKGLPDPPLALNLKGNLEALNSIGVAVIGTRTPTEDGSIAGKYFTTALANEKFNILSGLAIGCDSVAHKSTLDVNGITTAILAHGIDSVYPKENKKLFEKILDNDGLVVSEYFYGTYSKPGFFVQRDRIQAGLASGLVVIQSKLNGGTMHAVEAGLNIGLPIAAVLYKSMHAEEVTGNMKLINSGDVIALNTTNIEEFISTIRSFVRKRTEIKQQANLFDSKN